jgi:putative CocE/NonD family hydrolase
MGSTDHFDDPLVPDGDRVVDIEVDDAALDAFLPDYAGPAAEFFDRHLLGRGSQIPRVRWHLANEGWRRAEGWPPEGARELRLYPVDADSAIRGPEGGALAEAPGRHESPASWTHDPADPVPDLVADVWRPLMGLPDERQVEGRADVVTFTADPSRKPLDLAGPVVLTARVTGEGPSLQLTAKLVDVFPNGRARRILQGAMLVTDPDSEAPRRVELGHAGYRLHAGHRLRLEIASSDYPRYLWDPGTDEDPWTALEGTPRDRALHLGGREAPALTITAMP